MHDAGGAVVTPVLESYEGQFAAARGAIEGLVGGVSDAGLRWRPSESRWSIVECLEHLNSGWLILPKLDRRIAEARAGGVLGREPFREPWLGRLYVRAVEPPVRFRVPAPRRFRPRADPSPVEVVPRILAFQDEVIARIRASEGLDLGAIRMRSPISRRFRMTLGQWFAFLAAHERRHIWQAENVKRHLLEREGA